VALFMTGLAGLSFHVLRDDGWLEETFGRTWDFTVRYPMIAIPLILGALAMGKMWRDDRVGRGKQSTRAGSMALYAIVAAGIYYTGHFLIYRTF
jgi:hypothetical protein